MEMLEKVERLRERADVSYEEAREALEQTSGDLLDAMVLLEQQGKVRGSGKSAYSTEYDAQKELLRVKDKVEDQNRRSAGVGHTIGRLVRSFFGFIRSTVFIVTRREDTIFTMPTWVFALLLFLFWELLAPVMVIALFLDVRYSFDGNESAETANTILEKAGDFAEDVRSEFRKEDPEGDDGSTDPAGGR